MTERAFSQIIGVLLILGILGDFLTYCNIDRFNNVSPIIGGFGRIAGLILIISKGSLIKSKSLFKITFILLIFILIGLLMKILFLPFAGFVFFTGITGFWLIYNYHFYKKLRKGILDIIKLVWLTILLTAITFQIYHYPFNKELISIANIVFLVMYFYFLLNLIKSGNSAKICA